MGFNAYDKDDPLHLTTYQREVKRISEGRERQLSEALRTLDAACDWFDEYRPRMPTTLPNWYIDAKAAKSRRGD